MGDLIDELLRPRTDGGVLAQLVIVILLVPPGLWWARNDADRRWLVLGLAVFVLSWFALRTLH